MKLRSDTHIEVPISTKLAAIQFQNEEAVAGHKYIFTRYIVRSHTA